MKRKELVLSVLQTAQRQWEETMISVPGRYGKLVYVQNDLGKVRASDLTRPALGGSDGLRRVRELREDGYDVRWCYMKKNGKRFDETLYWLV